MSNARDEDPFWVDDRESIGRVARNQAERRRALDVCLAEFWADEDVGRLERLDGGEDHGWLMWRWKKA